MLWSGARHASLFLNSRQVRGSTVASLNRPGRAASQHRIHFRVVQMQLAGAAESRRDVCAEGIGQGLSDWLNLLAAETSS